MNSKVYKWCAVPMCKNTSISTPNKLFIYVPNKKTVRDKWLKLARRNPEAVLPHSSLYFCEDHFDLPNDMENYMRYHVMGFVSQVRMKPGCIPKTFACQPDRKKRTSKTLERPHIRKKRKRMVLEECEKQLEDSSMDTEHLDYEEIESGNSVPHNLAEAQQVTSKMIDKSIQVDMTETFRSKAKKSSPISLQMECDAECEMIEKDKKLEDLKIIEYSLKKIIKNPLSYIGVPISCYYLISLIQKQTNIPYIHILLCLKKIRLNNSFRELADDFAMHAIYASRIFFKNIPILASVIRPFIVKYNKVKCTSIIDCMEIEIQKPSKELNQDLSWSDDKKANTIKYLVSCTPNGLVNYISNGYGGRISDTYLIESCDFLKCKPGVCVMSDGGFKHVEGYLRKKGVILVRPPSVESGNKPSMTEAKEMKQIASLRIHIERVIGRLQEFNMIKPHSSLDLSLVKVLDDVITIACGLINLQDSLIK